MKKYGDFTRMLFDISKDIYSQMKLGSSKGILYMLPGGAYKISVEKVKVENGVKFDYVHIEEYIK